MTKARYIRRVLVGLVVGCYLVIILSPMLLPKVGLDVLAVRSGSMEPSIMTGALVIVTDDTDIAPNDVITFRRPGQAESIVTHRVTRLAETSEGELVYRTQGDANGTEDAWQVAPSAVLGSVAFDIPKAGFLYVFLSSPPVRLGVVLTLVVVILAPKRKMIDIKTAEPEKVAS